MLDKISIAASILDTLDLENDIVYRSLDPSGFVGFTATKPEGVHDTFKVLCYRQESDDEYFSNFSCYDTAELEKCENDQIKGENNVK